MVTYWIITDIDGTIIDNSNRKYYCAKIAINDSVTYEQVNSHYNIDHLKPSQKQKTKFWDLFLSEIYMNHTPYEDTPIVGAEPVLTKWYKKGIIIAYATGRHHDVKTGQSMKGGTLHSLNRMNFPLPDDQKVFLFMKPNRWMKDIDFKQQIYQKVAYRGTILAIIGNRPNDVDKQFHRLTATRIGFSENPYSTKDRKKFDNDVILASSWKKVDEIIGQAYRKIC